jgi:hypothetical protein
VSVVQHLASLPVWERKARRVTVEPAGPRTGTYTAAGRIAGLVPWRATFEYELTETGFHSWMPTPRRGVQVAGGFHVINEAPGSCTVAHYEQYHLPFANRSIAFAWHLYVTHTMTTELERIALLAQTAPPAERHGITRNSCPARETSRGRPKEASLPSSAHRQDASQAALHGLHRRNR